MLPMIVAAAGLWCFNTPIPTEIETLRFGPRSFEAHSFGVYALPKFHGAAVLVAPCLDQDGPHSDLAVQVYLKKRNLKCRMSKPQSYLGDGGGWLVRLDCPNSRLAIARIETRLGKPGRVGRHLLR